MKKILFLFLILSSTSFAQIDIPGMAEKFSNAIPENPILLSSEDITTINNAVFPENSSLDEYWAALMELEISDQMINSLQTEQEVWKQLEYICSPFWRNEFNNPEEIWETLSKMDVELGKLKNGRVAQYLFAQIILSQGMEAAPLGELKD